MRRLRPQGTAQGGQPHADRMRGARPLPRRARLDRSGSPAHPCARAQLFVVELPLVLAPEGSGTPPRSHVGFAPTGHADESAPGRGGDPQVGATLGPRTAGHGVRSLSEPSPSRRAAQAVDALRHGWPLAIGKAPLLLPVETAPGEARSAHALISGARAATLKLTNQREAADAHAPVLIRAADPLDLASARPIADPALDLAVPLKGPFLAEPLAWVEEATAAMELARLAGILPAFLVAPEPAHEPVAMEAGDLRAFVDPTALAIATRA